MRRSHWQTTRCCSRQICVIFSKFRTCGWKTGFSPDFLKTARRRDQHLRRHRRCGVLFRKTSCGNGRACLYSPPHRGEDRPIMKSRTSSVFSIGRLGNPQEDAMTKRFSSAHSSHPLYSCVLAIRCSFRPLRRYFQAIGASTAFALVVLSSLLPAAGQVPAGGATSPGVR